MGVFAKEKSFTARKMAEPNNSFKMDPILKIFQQKMRSEVERLKARSYAVEPEHEKRTIHQR